MHHQMIWVRIPAIFVIGDDDVWAKLADHLDKFLRNGVVSLQREAALR